jgi:uncharacterized membrane protein YbaN (DUF454 family)
VSRTLRRVLVFVAGLFLIIAGLLLVVLPGPLTIPPILLGVWLWSREFEFARRLLRPVQERSAVVWAQARAKPIHTSVITVAGLAAAVTIIWTVVQLDLLERGAAYVGIP